MENHDDDLRKHDQDSFMKVYRFISEKAQKNTPKGDWNLIRSHNVRKYFNSALLNAGADSFHVEYFMGHTLDDTRAAYFRASPEKLRELYQKFMPFLTIQKEADISESPEYLRVKQENQILQAETERHIVERKELQELREKTEKQEKQLKEHEESAFILKKSVEKLEGTDIILRMTQQKKYKRNGNYSAYIKQHREPSLSRFVRQISMN